MHLLARSAAKLRHWAAYAWNYLHRRHPFQMWGREFDLRRKRLVELQGFSLYVMPDDYIGHSIIARRAYEPHVTSVLRSILREGDVFLDVGANLGYFTLLASSVVGARGRVLALEPNPQNLQLIYESLLHNGASNVVVFPFAASDAAAILRFVTVGSNGGVVTAHAAAQDHSLLVQAVILDQMLGDEPRIDAVKMDIEAHEPAALRGMAGIIRRHRPRLITEFHPWAMRLNNVEPPEAYLRQLIDSGYGLAVILESGELRPAASASEIMSHWRSFGQETLHLDLLAEPLER
jgi:FkbM family methyltransferase